MTRNIVTGIDVGSASIKVAAVEYVEGHKQPRILALATKESLGVRHGYISDIDEAGRAIAEAVRAAEAAAKVKLRRAYVGLGGITLESRLADGSVAVSRADQEVSEGDVARAIAQSEQSMPDALNRQVIQQYTVGFKLDGKKVLGRPVGLKGSKLEVRSVFITSLSQHLNDLVTAVAASGVAIDDIIPSPVAAAAVTLTRVQKMAGCVLANIGSQTTSIVVYEDTVPISLKVFPFGSMDITHDIAIGLRISPEDAERMKTGAEEPGNTRRKLDEIIDARLSEMFDVIEVHLKKLGRNGLLPAGIVITGGGSGTPDIATLAKESLKIPARIAAPENGLVLKSSIPDSAWAVAYGLCMLGKASEEEEFGTRTSISKGKNKFVKWFRELLP